MAFLGNVEKQQFQLKSTDRIQAPLKGPLLELLDCPIGTTMIEEWFPEKDLNNLNLWIRFPSLTSEQHNALAEMLITPKTLINITADTGKSYLLGTVLRLCLDRAIKGELLLLPWCPRQERNTVKICFGTWSCFCQQNNALSARAVQIWRAKRLLLMTFSFFAATRIAVEEARQEYTERACTSGQASEPLADLVWAVLSGDCADMRIQLFVFVRFFFEKKFLKL